MPSQNAIPEEWSNDLRAAWDKTFKEPHMQAGLAILREFSRIKGTSTVLPPGVDARDLAANAFHYATGQASVLEDIERMRKEKPKALVPLRDEEMFTPPKE